MVWFVFSLWQHRRIYAFIRPQGVHGRQKTERFLYGQGSTSISGDYRGCIWKNFRFFGTSGWACDETYLKMELFKFHGTLKSTFLKFHVVEVFFIEFCWLQSPLKSPSTLLSRPLYALHSFLSLNTILGFDFHKLEHLCCCSSIYQEKNSNSEQVFNVSCDNHCVQCMCQGTHPLHATIFNKVSTFKFKIKWNRFGCIVEFKCHEYGFSAF